MRQTGKETAKKNKRKRIFGGGSMTSLTYDQEESLFEFFINRRSQNLRVTNPDLQQWANNVKRVKSYCKDNNITLVLIPGGLTPYVQTADVGLFRSFKSSLSTSINSWKTSDKVTYTKAGNPRRPSNATVEDWVKIANKSLNENLVQKAIDICGFDANYCKWYISKHDKLGSKFVKRYE